MKAPIDPTLPIREAAAAFDNVVTGTSCNQNSFKTPTGSFLFIGPGRRGVGYKAMFKLRTSLSQAEELARSTPGRFEVGSTAWVTARFTDEDPLPQAVWEPWLKESYDITTGKSP